MRERARSLWRWLDGRTGLDWGKSEPVLMIRLIRGRALAVFGLVTALAFAWLDHAGDEVSLSAATILVVTVFALAAWKLAAQDDPHWWRSGVSTLGLVAIVGAILGEPPGSVPVFELVGMNSGENDGRLAVDIDAFSVVTLARVLKADAVTMTVGFDGFCVAARSVDRDSFPPEGTVVAATFVALHLHKHDFLVAFR